MEGVRDTGKRAAGGEEKIRRRRDERMLKKREEDKKCFEGLNETTSNKTFDDMNLNSDQVNRKIKPDLNMLFENLIERENNKWLTTKQAAMYLAVSENALRIMVFRNQIPVFKLGNRLRFRIKDCLGLFQRKGT